MGRQEGTGDRLAYVAESDPAELLSQVEQWIGELEAKTSLNKAESQRLEELRMTRATLEYELDHAIGSGNVTGQFTLEGSGNGGNKFGSGPK